MTTSDSENLKDNPDLGSIFEESCKVEKTKELLSKSLGLRDYVDLIDSEHPNDKGRDD